MEIADLMNDKEKAKEIGGKIAFLAREVSIGGRMAIAFSLIAEALSHCEINKDLIHKFLEVKMDEVVAFMMDELTKKGKPLSTNQEEKI